jgi:multidrug efflux pump subunit AcrA (membrane-fusion protein)
MTRVGTIAALFAVLVIAGLAIWGFIEGRGEAAREAEEEQPIKSPTRVSIEGGVPVVTLDAAAQQADGIATSALKKGVYQSELQAYGTVLDLAPLTDLASGHATAQAQLETAQAKLAASQTAFERAQKLYKDQQNVSAAQLQAAEAAFRVDQAELAAAQSRLRMLALAAQQNWGPALGQALVDGTPLVTRLLTGRDVLIQVTLHPGEAVEEPVANAFVRRDDGSSVPLHFISPATKTDPRIQGPSFFFTAPAKSGLLPGMSLVAFLPSGHSVEGVLVPSVALVWGEGHAWAYFRTGPTTFTRRAVATDRPWPDGGYVMADQPSGTEVVVQGAQMLFSEEFRAQVRIGD